MNKSALLAMRIAAVCVLAVPFVLLALELQTRRAMGDGGFYLLLSLSGVAILPAAYAARQWFSSLRITVVLLTLGLILIFVGTLAQTTVGIWVAINDYFRSLYVWVPLDIFREALWPQATKEIPGRFIFPGGFLIMGLLIINLIAAHAVRYRVTAKGGKLALGIALTLLSTALFAVTVGVPSFNRAIQQDVILMLGIWAVPTAIATIATVMLFSSRKAGIVLIHVGMILMLLGEFVTGLAAEEGQMAIPEFGSSNVIYDIREPELAFVTELDNGNQRHVVIPRSMLLDAVDSGEPISHPQLPVQVRVDRYMANSTPVPQGVAADDRSKVVWGVEEMEAFDGLDQQVDSPAVVIALMQDGRVLGRYTLATYETLPPARLEADGRPWQIDLRYKQDPLNYSLQLHDFRSERFTGSTTPKNFSSDLRLVDEQGQARSIFIKMNQPLRHDGKAFYQQSFFQRTTNMNTGTILQTADNPGAWIPYLSCVIVTVGLCAQFGASLMRYGRRTAAKGIGN